MKTLVLGAGRSGRAAAALLGEFGRETLLLDGDRPFPDSVDFDEVIVSPGIALSHPWAVAARRHGLTLKSELQLGCEALRRRGWKLMAVTGSKGKSSVVKVIAEAIRLSGREAVACGNYGLPVSELAKGSPAGAPAAPGLAPWAVVEVSSFMMETTTLAADTFEAAVILNLQEDHLDRHGSKAVYHALKRRLLAFARRGFEEVPANAVDPSLFAGSYFDNPVLAGNAAAAVELMRVAGVDEATIRRTFRDFRALPHRMNLVAEAGGVSYIDDSKATSIAALVAGVEMATARQGGRPDGRKTIRLIAGGLPKGDDPKTALPVLTERVKKVYLIGECAERFAAAWREGVDCEICGTLERAVAAVKRDAAEGECGLLSPGSASFDQFKSFEERGEVFARLVKKDKGNE